MTHPPATPNGDLMMDNMAQKGRPFVEYTGEAEDACWRKNVLPLTVHLLCVCLCGHLLGPV